MNHLLRPLLFSLPLALGLSGCSPDPLLPSVGTKVVLIIVDTLRADATEGSWTKTPNLAQFAQDGVRFGMAFSHAPSTLPSHTALFASRPPHQTGVINNGTDVPEDLPLLAQHLSEQGYQTRAIVSLGTLNRLRANGNPGLSRGFDSYDQDYWHIDNAAGALARMKSSLDALDGSKPFFLFAHFSDPHSPYSGRNLPEKTAKITIDGELFEWIPTSSTTTRRRSMELEAGDHIIEIESDDLFLVKDFEFRKGSKEVGGEWFDGNHKEAANKHSFRLHVEKSDTYLFRYWLTHKVERSAVEGYYKSEVEYVDEYVGQLLAELKSRGWYDECLIVFASDHGESLGNPGRIGHMQNLKDELLHVPLIIKLPASHAGTPLLRKHASQLVPLIDVVPTILDVAGLPALPGQQGSSLIEGSSAILVAETHRPEANNDYIGIRDERFKMIYAPAKDRFVMYDMLEDPGESKNIFGQAKLKREGWEAQLRKYTEIASKPPTNVPVLTADEVSDMKALGYMGASEEEDI